MTTTEKAILNARWSEGTHHNSTAFDGAVVMNKNSSPTASSAIIVENEFMKNATKSRGEPIHMLPNSMSMVLPLFESEPST